MAECAQGHIDQPRPQRRQFLRRQSASAQRSRPIPLGLSVVAFEGMAGAGTLNVRFLDCIDGTPLLDIKPDLKTTDCEPTSTMGWLEQHSTRRR